MYLKNMRKKIIILTTISILAIVSLMTLSFYGKMNDRGTVTLGISPTNASVKINDKSVSGKIHRLSPGKHTITVSQQDYITATQEFTVAKKQEQTIAISLVKENVKNTVITEVRKELVVKELFLGNNTNVEVSNAESFDNDTWLVAAIKLREVPYITIWQKNSLSGEFEMLMGPGKPGEYLEDEDSGLPNDVTQSARNMLNEL